MASSQLTPNGMKVPFGIGSTFKLDGDTLKVVQFDGKTVGARTSHGNTVAFSLAHLFSLEGFELENSGYDPSEDAQLEGIPDDVLLVAQRLAAHVLEAITGYSSGSESDRKADEPKSEYDPRLNNQKARIRYKASELACSERTLWNLKASYERHGIRGLVDGRTMRQAGTKVDARYVAALKSAIAYYETESTPSRAAVKRRTRIILKESQPGEDIKEPSDSTFSRLVNELSKGKRTFGEAKQRRSNANRPDTPYSQFHAQRPGELILLDSTNLDMFAMDPYTFEWVQVQLTIAVDLYSRSLPAWRFTPVSTKGVDAAFLLLDIIRPKPLNDCDPKLRWSYLGVPEYIVLEIPQPDIPDIPIPLLKIPFLHPESVMVDRGRVFLSDVFMTACRKLGINVMVARPYTPTDKAHVERMFRTIRENFVAHLAGYKGPNVYHRGENMEEKAFWFIDELNENFGEWIAAWWQNREHEGLDLPNLPALKISPNNMLEEGFSKAGFVYASPSNDLYYELLPTKWRYIHHYGVELDGLRYDGDSVNDFRDVKSDYPIAFKGKWPFKYDPRDKSLIFFKIPGLDVWRALTWVGARNDLRPFNDKTVSYAKAELLRRQMDPSSTQDMEKVLNGLIDRWESKEVIGRERRIAALSVAQTANAAKDRAVATPKALRPSAANREESEGNDALEHSSISPAAQHVFVEALRTVDEIGEDEDDDLAI